MHLEPKTASAQADTALVIPFGFAGIRWELLARPGFDTRQLPSEFTEAVGDPDDSFATFVGALHWEEQLDDGEFPMLHAWTWHGDHCSVDAGRVVGNLLRVLPGRYAASLRVKPRPHGVAMLLTSMSAAIAEREGGCVLHACGVDLDGRAVLFIGPTGAGKSTAAGAVEGARVFANDRVLVNRTAGEWRAWALPGGQAAPNLAPCEHARSLPVGAIIRVTRSRRVPEVERLDSARAVTILRESMRFTQGSTTDESKRLALAAELALEVPVVLLRSVLGHPLRELVRSVESHSG